MNRGSFTRVATNIVILLCKVKEHYSDVPVYVMANGVQEDPARFKDSLRVYYLYNYINEALKGATVAMHIVTTALCTECFILQGDMSSPFTHQMASAEFNH